MTPKRHFEINWPLPLVPTYIKLCITSAYLVDTMAGRTPSYLDLQHVLGLNQLLLSTNTCKWKCMRYKTLLKISLTLRSFHKYVEELCLTKKLLSKRYQMIWLKQNLLVSCSKFKEYINRTYRPFGSASSVHSFFNLPLNFHGNLHSAFLSGLSLVVRHLGPRMKSVFL